MFLDASPLTLCLAVLVRTCQNVYSSLARAELTREETGPKDRREEKLMKKCAISGSDVVRVNTLIHPLHSLLKDAGADET
jgi:hypothetical protein